MSNNQCDSDSQTEHGFTLIELLVVILIIGILAAIAVPVFLNQRTKANEATLQSDLKNSTLAVESHVDKLGKYPLALETPLTGSEGIILDYTSNGLSYCVKAIHPNVPSPWYYDSVLDGISQTSCSLKSDAEGDFYNAVPGGPVIYGGAGTWKNNGTGPSGATIMELAHNPGANVGWGIYGTYDLTNGVIPQGSKVSLSYYIRTTKAYKDSTRYLVEIQSGDAQETVSKGMVLHATSSWQRVTKTIVTERDWIPGRHRVRFGLSGYENLEISDVQVDIVSKG